MSNFKADLLRIALREELPRLLSLALTEERFEDAALIRDEMARRPSGPVEFKPCSVCGRKGCRTLHKTVAR